ncbi:glycosyltransferase [Polaribacter cellanae]|uniref:Glycosyltransferase family 4 protein n=1 Tax=Polaribacter cellanae TaxID=2818493 RepID=A0A975CPE3_9FLAO|nr:glycosyltransferase [Polaribacter cellanae]QTE23044.1 glycosyltransferase family 4 protein [Polaribacter cellanae]
MKILFVCQQYIHAARWINQLKDSGHEIYLFDCLDAPIHKDLLWTNYTTNWSKRKFAKFKGEYFLKKKTPKFHEKIAPYLQVTASEKLEELIKKIKPDLVHSLEMQSETYPLLKVRKKITFNWAYFSWGSDLYLYQHKKEHQYKIKNVLKDVNYLFTDNKRDVNLAKELDFRGSEMPIFPGGGGYKIEEYQKFSLSVEERKLILVKGYDHWAGKALFVLNALEIIVEDIRNFDIYVYSAHNKVIDKIKEINKKYAVNIEYSSRYNQISHNELLEKFGKAKIAIGNNISDGIANTLLEAIICGAFPIQSNPGGVTEEYINNGENGFLIENPEDVKEIASKIKKALNNNALLEKAFNINKEISEKLEYSKIKKEVLEAYKKIEKDI